MLKTVKDITNDYKIEQQKPNFGRRFVLTVLTDSNLRLAKLAFWQLLMWPFLCYSREKTKEEPKWQTRTKTSRMYSKKF